MSTDGVKPPGRILFQSDLESFLSREDAALPNPHATSFKSIIAAAAQSAGDGITAPREGYVDVTAASLRLMELQRAIFDNPLERTLRLRDGMREAVFRLLRRP